MPLPPDQAWFAAKRYGYGWGFPRRWQGWAVMGGYLAAVVALTRPGGLPPAGCIAGTLVLTAALVLVCWWKGEPLRWRWGERH